MGRLLRRHDPKDPQSFSEESLLKNDLGPIRMDPDILFQINVYPIYHFVVIIRRICRLANLHGWHIVGASAALNSSKENDDGA